MDKNVYLYVFDTMSDWETGYLAAELNSGRFFKSGVGSHPVVTVGADKAPIRTMGGITVIPDIAAADCIPEKDSAAALILPGGVTWLEDRHEAILSKVKEFRDSGVLIGAICGATLGLANAGFLDSSPHTGNSLDFMKQVCPNYRGGTFYRNEPAVVSEGLITASGVAPLEFAYEILRALDVFLPETLQAWYQLYTDKTEESFFRLMGSLDH